MKILLTIILLAYPALFGVSLIVHVLSRRRVGSLARDTSFRPTVTIIIASAGEGEAVVREKLQNTLALEYPTEALEIILFSDGIPFPASLDRAAFPQVSFLEFGRIGKTECQNRCVAVAKGDIVIFTDITSRLDAMAIQKLVRWYTDDGVGSVGGSFSYRFAKANVEARYVSREIRLKAGHGQYGIVTGYFGPLYSVRRSAYPVMPAFYPSDYMLPVLVSMNGRFGMLDPEAVSYRVLERKMDKEFSRKRRIIAQGVASTMHLLRERGRELVRRPDLLSAILIRKLFRWLLVPYGVIVYVNLLFVPALFHAATAAGLCLIVASLLYHRSGGRNSALLAPFYGLVISGATLLALLDVLRGETYATWDPGSR